ncbi:hypothetical protein DM01DRAFT_1336993 [Hesseltinella vesiculosa]|uniref:Uncharacterized protein n=1 Tax=Hesseltinella vesiculosa TaxID=101127 RepID=A0A1X2GEM7_9FUNG|nr:hypothetical protein DM01DRAFT_1336993 [Hesseltinella vesiculosa]
MTYKAGFEPKDARTISTFDDDDDLDDLDDWSLDASPRPRRRTGTQALVEFLNTTSPEEFRKAPTTSKRSTFFSRRRNKKKPSSNHTVATSTAPPHIIRRNGYVEIITNHHPTRIPYAPTSSTLAPVPSTSLQHHLRRPSNGLSAHVDSSDQPVLPNRRESSIYSASIRSQPFSPTSITSAPDILSRAISTNNNNKRMPALPPKTVKPDPDALVTALEGMDVVEAGLALRLKQYDLAKADHPSDQVSKVLIEEHLRALNISAALSSPPPGEHKKSARHVQVQTMPIDLSTDLAPSPTATISSTPDSLSPDKRTQTEDDPDSTKQSFTVEELQRQITQERLERQRLEAALRNTCDHFEVLSGLAYKKLRELWEEKVRWENACVELNNQLIAINQQSSVTDSRTLSDISN